MSADETAHNLILSTSRTLVINNQKDPQFSELINNLIEFEVAKESAYEELSEEMMIKIADQRFKSFLNYLSDHKNSLNKIQIKQLAKKIDQHDTIMIALMELWVSEVQTDEELIDTLFLIVVDEPKTDPFQLKVSQLESLLESMKFTFHQTVFKKLQAVSTLVTFFDMLGTRRS